MQPIERYGVVALLFLVVTVLAVLMWDDPDETVAVAAAGERAAAVPAPAGEVELRRRPRPRPLRRDLEPPSPAVEAQEAAVRQATLRGDAAPAGAAVRPEPMAAASAAEERVLIPRRSEPQVAARETASAPARTAPERPTARVARPEAVADRVYVIRSGDTLSEVAMNELGTSKRWKDIVDLNPGLDPSRLKVGARLLMPEGYAAGSSGAATPSAARASEERAAPASADGPTYRVRSGDSMWKIAERTLGEGERWKEIEAANPDVDPGRLAVGQELRLPADASSDEAPQVASATATERERVQRQRVR